MGWGKPGRKRHGPGHWAKGGSSCTPKLWLGWRRFTRCAPARVAYPKRAFREGFSEAVRTSSQARRNPGGAKPPPSSAGKRQGQMGSPCFDQRWMEFIRQDLRACAEDHARVSPTTFALDIWRCRRGLKFGTVSTEPGSAGRSFRFGLSPTTQPQHPLPAASDWTWLAVASPSYLLSNLPHRIQLDDFGRPSFPGDTL